MSNENILQELKLNPVQDKEKNNNKIKKLPLMISFE
jgi:hypothetical protein